MLGRGFLPSARDTSRSALPWVLLAALALAVGAWLSAPGGKALYIVIVLAAFGVIAWRLVLTPEECDFVRHPLRNAVT